MEFTLLSPVILIEEEILNGDLVCSCTVDADCTFSITSPTMEYFSIDSANGNVYLTNTGLIAINEDFPTEPHREITELYFEYIATQIQTGLQIYQSMIIDVVRVHDSEPVVTNIFVEPTYTESLNDSMRIFEIRTAYPALFTVIGTHFNNFQVPDENVGRITLTPEGNDYLQTLDWSDPALESIGQYKIQPVTVQVNIEDRENNKTIQYDIDLIVYEGNKDPLLPTKNMNELMGESLGEFVGRLAGRLDITNNEFLMELETIKMNTTVLIDKTFQNEALSTSIENNIEDLIQRLKESEDYRDTRFQSLIESFRSNFIDTVFETLSTYHQINNNVKEIMEVGGLDNTNIQDAGSAKAMGYAAMDFARYYSDYNKVWSQHYTDRKVNLSMGDLDYKLNEARDRINTSILNTYNTYFSELAQELNINIGVIEENFNAIRKLDYRGSETERHVGLQEDRMRTLEGYDLSDWDMDPENWSFDADSLNYNSLWKVLVDGNDDLFLKGEDRVILRADSKDAIWDGNQLLINNAAAGSSVRAETFFGRATTANYADLAELYRANRDYEIGTLLSIETDKDADWEVCLYDPLKPYAGIVSDKPGFLLNADEDNQEDRLGQHWIKVALTGRVQVQCTRVIGENEEIGKGIYLYADEISTGLAFGSPRKIEGREVIGITIACKDEETNLVLAKVN